MGETETERGQLICEALEEQGIYPTTFTIDNTGELFLIIRNRWILRYLGIREHFGRKVPLWGPVRPTFKSIQNRVVDNKRKLEYYELY